MSRQMNRPTCSAVFHGLAISCACLLSTGCGDTNVQFPGGAVKIENGRVQVEAPGVNVDVQPGEGVNVEAPGVEVNHRVGEGVDVRAPGTTVRARRNGDVEVQTPGGVNVDTNPNAQIEAFDNSQGQTSPAPAEQQPRRIDL